MRSSSTFLAAKTSILTPRHLFATAKSTANESFIAACLGEEVRNDLCATFVLSERATQVDSTCEAFCDASQEGVAPEDTLRGSLPCTSSRSGIVDGATTKERRGKSPSSLRPAIALMGREFFFISVSATEKSYENWKGFLQERCVARGMQGAVAHRDGRESWSAQSDRRGLPSKPQATLPEAPPREHPGQKAPTEVRDELKAAILESFHANSYEQGLKKGREVIARYRHGCLEVGGEPGHTVSVGGFRGVSKTGSLEREAVVSRARRHVPAHRAPAEQLASLLRTCVGSRRSPEASAL